MPQHPGAWNGYWHTSPRSETDEPPTQRAADNDRDEIYALICSMPSNTDKTAIHRASGVSRPTVYQLLQKGLSLPTEPELVTDVSSVREYIARIRAVRVNPDAVIGVGDVVAAFVADAEYSVGNRRSDGADWYWPDLENALGFRSGMAPVTRRQ